MTLVYLTELQLNKANTSDKESSFLDLNVKVISSEVHTSVYDKRDYFEFPMVNFPWLSGDVRIVQSSHWLYLLGVVIAFRIPIVKSSNLF